MARFLLVAPRQVAESVALAHQIVHHMMRVGAPIAGVTTMRTTVTLDDELLKQAEQATGMSERSALLRAGLIALIERESARRLARLGGSEPQLERVPRRQAEPE